MTKKEMMAFIDKVVKECGQVPLGCIKVDRFGAAKIVSGDEE